MLDIIEQQGELRISIFLIVFLAMAGLELCLPRRTLTQPRVARWRTNWLLAMAGTLVVRITLPLVALSTAVIVHSKGWGILPLLSLPTAVEMIVSVIILDGLIYGQHVATHKFHWLWQLHQVHHVDRDLDVTTALRFHPFEILLSMLYKMAAIVLLGPAVIGVLILEILLNAAALFNHANLRLAPTLDYWLRWFIVTPNMHLIHHSTKVEETDSNYGFLLSCWDRLFKTYTEKPSAGYAKMQIGLAQHQHNLTSKLWWSIKLPFVATVSKDPSSEVQAIKLKE